MNLSIELIDVKWQKIFTIPQGTVLQKGRKGPFYKELIDASCRINDRFGVYAWGKDEKNIYYCGSFSKDYTSGKFKSNFHGRIAQYMGNHDGDTNKMVFDYINIALKSEDVNLFLLQYVSANLNGSILLATGCQDAGLIKLIERLLIYTNKTKGQVQWNRS